MVSNQPSPNVACLVVLRQELTFLPEWMLMLREARVESTFLYSLFSMFDYANRVRLRDLVVAAWGVLMISFHPTHVGNV